MQNLVTCQMVDWRSKQQIQHTIESQVIAIFLGNDGSVHMVATSCKVK